VYSYGGANSAKELEPVVRAIVKSGQAGLDARLVQEIRLQLNNRARVTVLNVNVVLALSTVLVTVQ